MPWSAQQLMVYLPTLTSKINHSCIGKYTNRPMDPIWVFSIVPKNSGDEFGDVVRGCFWKNPSRPRNSLGTELVTSFKQEFLLGSCGYAPFNLAKLARDLTRVQEGKSPYWWNLDEFGQIVFFLLVFGSRCSCLTGYLIVKIDGASRYQKVGRD